MNFLKNYTISNIDEQTLVVQPGSNSNRNKPDNSDGDIPDLPAYLIKFMNLPKNTCDLTEIIDTLSHHQTLQKKYLLTLESYEITETSQGTNIQAIYHYSQRSLK